MEEAKKTSWFDKLNCSDVASLREGLTNLARQACYDPEADGQHREFSRTVMSWIRTWLYADLNLRKHRTDWNVKVPSEKMCILVDKTVSSVVQRSFVHVPKENRIQVILCSIHLSDLCRIFPNPKYAERFDSHSTDGYDIDVLECSTVLPCSETYRFRCSAVADWVVWLAVVNYLNECKAYELFDDISDSKLLRGRIEGSIMGVAQLTANEGLVINSVHMYGTEADSYDSESDILYNFTRADLFQHNFCCIRGYVNRLQITLSNPEFVDWPLRR